MGATALTTATSSTTASTAAALSPARTNLCLALLVLLGFSLGCSEFVVIGIESDLATELGISLATAGQLISVFALVYAIATPVLALSTGRFRRYQLLVCYSIVFVLGNLVMALAPNFQALFISRIILGSVSGALLAVGVTYIPELLSPQQTSLAISVVYGAFSVAMVFVTSIGKFVADTLDWHVAMYGTLTFAVLICAALVAFMPRAGQTDEPATFREQAGLLREPSIITGMLIFLFGVGSVYVFYGYVTPYLEQVLGMGTVEASTTLMAYGVFCLISNKHLLALYPQTARELAGADTKTVPTFDGFPRFRDFHRMLGRFGQRSCRRCDKGTVPFSHREGCTDGWVAEGLAEPGGQLLRMALQVAVELGGRHAAHFRDFLLVDVQLARLNMGREHLTPFALAAAVAVILAVDHVPQVLKLVGLAHDAELFVDAARRRSGNALPRERMASAAIGQHPAPQALERAAATEQQTCALALTLDQKRQECLMQDTLAGMCLDAVDGAEHLAGRGIDRYDLGARAALIPAGTQNARGGFLERGDELLSGVEHALQVVTARLFNMKARACNDRHAKAHGQRRRDIVRWNLVAMARNGQDAHRRRATGLGARNGLRRGAQVRELRRAGINRHASRRHRQLGLERKLAFAHRNLCRVHTHGISCRPRFTRDHLRLYCDYTGKRRM